MERLWSKSFILMTIGMFCLFVSFYMLYPTLPLFIKEIGGNESQVGLVMGVFMLSAVIIRPFVGWLLDRFGSRQFLIFGLLCFGTAMYLYNWIGGIFVLMVLRAFHGITWGFSTTSFLTGITDLIPTTRRGEGLGWAGMAMTLAMAIGPMFGLWLAQNFSYYSLFLYACGLAVVALCLTIGAKIPEKPRESTGKIQLFERSVLPISISVFFLFIAYGGITTFIPLFADSINVNSGTFFLVYAVTIILVRPIAGKLSDRYSEVIVIIPSLVVTILALIILSFSTNVLGMLISAVIYGIGFGSSQPALQAATIRLVSPNRTGIANASFSTATDLGIGLGAIILGWVSQYASYQVLFTVSAMSVVFSMLLFTLYTRRLKKDNENHSLIRNAN
ncbi:MFS transporter [Metabacillus sp. FJAT-53654]|uniref:MFS transporter n=1 Tax=Metabacillus rhizosphaerae TaxID=3117747 RepID=A0ABZ2MT33_9BACI